MITKLILCCLLTVWVLLSQSDLRRVHAEETRDLNQTNSKLQHNQTISQLFICFNNTAGSENVATDESLSASMLKLSHQPAPNLLKATNSHEQHHQTRSSERVEHREAATINANQRASHQAKPPPPPPSHSDKSRRFNLIDPPLQPARSSTTESASQLDNGKTKRKGLMSFMPQPRKLSISSLLPVRSSATKQAAPSTNNTSSQTVIGNKQGPKHQPQQIDTNIGSNLLTGALSEEEFNIMLNDPNGQLNDNLPYLSGASLSSLHLPQGASRPQDPRLTMANHPLQDYHNHHNHHYHRLPPTPFEHNHGSFGGAHFDSQFMASMHPPPSLHLVSPSQNGGHHFAAFQQFPHSAQHRLTTPQEIFLADQSGEHFQRIKLNKLASLPPAGGQSVPFILASTSTTIDPQQQLNRTALLQAAAAAALAQQQQQQHQRQAVVAQSQSSGNASATTALTSVAANALLSDRAKNLISQLNLAAAAVAATNASKQQSNVRNNRETTSEQPVTTTTTTTNGNATNNSNNHGLANMIKNAAEAWATTNSNRQSMPSQSIATSGSGVGGGVGVSADASPPTIIVEHDGPTVTTLDYSGLQRPMMPNQAPGDDEDDVTTNFYTENEEAEQEEGGSNEARRVVHPRINQQGHRSHHRHAPHQGPPAPPPPPPPLHHSLRHPDFNDYNVPHGSGGGGGSGYMMAQRDVPVPSANEFFDEQIMSDHQSDRQPTRLSANQGGDYGQPTPPGYYYNDHNHHDHQNQHHQNQHHHHQPRRPAPVQSTKDTRYPDSINAIKEQDDRQGPRAKQPSSSSSAGAQSTPDSSDPVEQLIKELQELHRRRKTSSDSSSSSTSSSSSGGRDGDDHERGSNRGTTPKGASSDEFEDILSVSGDRDKSAQDQDVGQEGGGGGGGSSSGNDEDEQTRLLRNKLLDRLRAKHDRKKGSLSSTATSFNGDSIRIPLHALLLAALDRRMSPSESKSVSTSADSSPPNPSGLLDDRNRELILSGRQDFNEATADMGSLLDGNQLFEQIIQSANGPGGGGGGGGGQQSLSSSSQQQLSGHLADDTLRLPLNLQNISQESLTPAGMLLIENLALLDETNQKKINLSDINGAGDGGGNLQYASTGTTRTPDSTSMTSTSTSTSSTTTTTPPTTTATPTSSPTSTSAPNQLRDAEMDLQLHHSRGNHRGLQANQRSFKNHRDASIVGAQKGRRALRDEEDFDVDRHVDEYANDKNDRSLEPSWMKTGRKNRRTGGGGGRPREGSIVEFDDEFDDIDRQTRRKIQQQRRRRAGARSKHGGNKIDDGNNNYEANEQRFFNKMQRDTDANIGDVDQTIRSIEQSIPDQEQPKARARAHHRGHRNSMVDRSRDDEEEPEVGQQSSGDDESDGADDEPGEASGSRSSRSHRSRSPEAAESQQSAATLRAGMIDEEIARMEEEAEEAKQKRNKAGVAQRRPPDQDPDDGDQQDDAGGEPSESQIEATRQAIGNNSPPVKSDT